MKMMMKPVRLQLALLVATMVSMVEAGIIEVPNGSFEAPATLFVDTRINDWQSTPKPDWYDESGGFEWSQLTGVFRNTPPESADHIVNVDGDQAAYLFAVPEVGFFQDYHSTDWANPTPTHAFDVRFEPGRSYTLTLGVAGGGGNMTSGVTLELSLYYRNTAGERIPVSVTSIPHSPELFPTNTRLIDFETHVPVVQADDPWANRPLGVQVQSTVQPELAGGYWNLDHVRLVASSTPPLLAASLVDGQFALNAQSEPGLRLEILTTSDVTLPLAEWTSLGVVTNVSGSIEVTDLDTTANRRLYRARQVP
jgi:hypothetical protein